MLFFCAQRRSAEMELENKENELAMLLFHGLQLPDVELEAMVNEMNTGSRVTFLPQALYPQECNRRHGQIGQVAMRWRHTNDQQQIVIQEEDRSWPLQRF